jgi:hypothetical protein
MIVLFILIYLVSLAIHIVMCYKEYKYAIYKVGDLIDLIEFHMWFPLLNTLMLIIVMIGIFIMTLWELLKLDILWEKFRSIKIR